MRSKKNVLFCKDQFIAIEIILHHCSEYDHRRPLHTRDFSLKNVPQDRILRFKNFQSAIKNMPFYCISVQSLHLEL
jgi:hypothetical protein